MFSCATPARHPPDGTGAPLAERVRASTTKSPINRPRAVVVVGAQRNEAPKEIGRREREVMAVEVRTTIDVAEWNPSLPVKRGQR
jgi:hypothetical protein